MAKKRKRLYLYLTLACFIAIIAIFVVDGYMGVYGTIYITAGEQEQKIEADLGMRGGLIWSTGVNSGEKVFFRYEVDNRSFSRYSADFEVSVWRAQEKILDVTSQTMTVGAFDKGEVDWTVDTAEVRPADIPANQSYEVSVVIERGGLEQRVILYINTQGPLMVPVPAIR